MANHTHGPGNHPAVHGMLLFGTAPIYLSHLPMFRAPHDLQVILEVQFRGPDDPARVYVRDRAQSGEKIYTWAPAPFVLTDLLNARPGPPRMTGTIFRGHFERGGTPITGDDVQCDVVKVMHSQPLSATSRHDGQLRYLTFGAPGAAFAVHLISAPPDFDQIVSVETPIAIDAAGKIVVVEGRQNESDHRLRAGDTVAALRCLDEVYFERDELRS